MVLKSDNSLKKIFFITISDENRVELALKNRVSQANYDLSRFLAMLKQLIGRIERNLHIKFVISAKTYEKYTDYLKKSNGNINSLRIKLEKNDFTKFTYHKVVKFVKKYELIWLSENYFNDIKAKLLIIS